MRILRNKTKKHTWKVYKSEAQEIIGDIINSYCLGDHFEFNRITIRNQKTRWGSCSSKKNLNFNFRIVFLPRELAEYLVIHEFCHLKQLNHSKSFWDLVHSFDHDYKRKQKLIKKYLVVKSKLKPIKIP